MRLSRTVKRMIGGLALATVLFAGWLWLTRPVWLFNWREFRAGHQIVAQVEAFRATNGRLPENLEQVGLQEINLKVFYRKISANDYIVWFGTPLGESKIYNSQRMKWE